MTEWAHYSLADLLMFSPEAYFRLFVLHNADAWPLALAMAGVALLLLRHLWSPGLPLPLVAIALAAAWGAVAWGFHWQLYAAINLAAGGFAAAFAGQSLALLATGLSRRRAPALGPARNRLPLWSARLLLLYALLLHPLAGLLAGRPWQGLELFGMAPDPTALATLALLLPGRGALRWWLAIIPLGWCLVSGLTCLAMAYYHGLATPVVALLVVALQLLPPRRGVAPAR